jgi:hypothetical protein
VKRPTAAEQREQGARQDFLEAKLVGVGEGAELQARKQFRCGQGFARPEGQFDAGGVVKWNLS